MEKNERTPSELEFLEQATEYVNGNGIHDSTATIILPSNSYKLWDNFKLEAEFLGKDTLISYLEHQWFHKGFDCVRVNRKKVSSGIYADYASVEVQSKVDMRWMTTKQIVTIVPTYSRESYSLGSEFTVYED